MAYGLQQITPPPGEPLSLAEARLYCRVDADNTLEDALITSLVIAARQYVENWLGFALVSQGWKLTIDRFPSLFWIGSWGNSYQDYQGYQGPSQGAGQGNWQWTLDGKTIRVPKPPLQWVTAFNYIDTTGAQNALTATSIAASFGSGVQTVTPGSMVGITAGGTVLVDVGANQEAVVVASVTPTTFTAQFALAHTGPVAVFGFQMATTKKPGLLSPIYGLTWPIAQSQYEAIGISFVGGYGPVTTVAAGVNAGANQVVTPASMFGIYPGTLLTIEPGTTNQETVAVTVTTATTFTATFARNHSTAPFAIGPALPETIKNALRALVSHWYENRGAVVFGTISKDMERAVADLLYSEWSGEYAA